jgi:hypothetical protein
MNFMTEEQQKQRAEMRAAADEMLYLIDCFERGALEEETPGVLENLRRIVRDREAWLRGEVILLALEVKEGPETAIRQIVDHKLKGVIEGARMYTQLEAIKHLRSWELMNHSPLRKIEREWLDRIFVGRERISKSWLDLAGTAGNMEDMGGHVEDGCPDSVNRKR